WEHSSIRQRSGMSRTTQGTLAASRRSEKHRSLLLGGCPLEIIPPSTIFPPTGTPASVDRCSLFVGTRRREAIMAESVGLKAENREGRGTRKARSLRQKGKIPGVVYGHKQETIPVALSAEELTRLIRHGTHVVDLRLDGGVEKALIRDLQWDHLGKDVLHVD